MSEEVERFLRTYGVKPDLNPEPVEVDAEQAVADWRTEFPEFAKWLDERMGQDV